MKRQARFCFGALPLLAMTLEMMGCQSSGAPEDAAIDERRETGVDATLNDLVTDTLTDTRQPEDVSLTDASDVSSDAGPCGDPATRPIILVRGEITSDTTWRCTNRYRLEGFVFVTNATPDARSTLTIEPGTIIEGLPGVRDGAGAITQLPGALIITRSGKIMASGTASQPIVFTSSRPAGTRAPADWGGLALLGRATNNTATGERTVEGVASSDARGLYGAPPGMQVEDWDCGTLRYVRVEFAGFEAAPMRELNGITLGSCGSRTVVDYVQVHQSSDDGIEIFGGSVNLSHAVITGAQDDLLDWDFGWTGRAQFIVGQQYERAYTGAADPPDKGIEADNNGTSPAATPISNPRIFNMTLLGTNTAESGRGVHLRAGSWGQISNAIIAGFGAGVIDVQTTESAVAARMGRLFVRNSIFAGVGGTVFPSGANDGADCYEGCTPDAGVPQANLIESDHFLAASEGNRVVDPRLPRPFDAANPAWVPPMDSPAATGGATPSGEADGGASDRFFDRSASYIGAFRPGGPDWTAGWCRFDAR